MKKNRSEIIWSVNTHVSLRRVTSSPHFGSEIHRFPFHPPDLPLRASAQMSRASGGPHPRPTERAMKNTTASPTLHLKMATTIKDRISLFPLLTPAQKMTYSCEEFLFKSLCFFKNLIYF